MNKYKKLFFINVSIYIMLIVLMLATYRNNEFKINNNHVAFGGFIFFQYMITVFALTAIRFFKSNLYRFNTSVTLVISVITVLACITFISIILINYRIYYPEISDSGYALMSKGMYVHKIISEKEYWLEHGRVIRMIIAFYNAGTSLSIGMYLIKKIE